MKKTYMIPTLLVVKIKTTGMIATSPTQSDAPAPQDGDGNYDSLGRGGDWDEDEY